MDAPQRRFGTAPDADEIGQIARRAIAALPQPFAAHVGELVVSVEELADDETLGELGIDDPFELSGVYHGVALGDKSVSDPARLPDRVILYRRAILDEWAAGGETLEWLVQHIVVHEVGHHFGLSDEDMARLEREGE